jgi:uncharacterized membrane protein YphA (DoxX/SURF4 family)
MRVIAPFLAVVASIFTIGAATARIWWDSLNRKVHDSQHTGREALPPGIKTALTWYLIAVGVILTGLGLFIIVKTVVSLSA